jgi:hypothetical protein
MTFKPRVWYPISAVLAALNLVSVGFAAAAAEPWHAGVHAVLGLAFGLWAQRLRQRLGDWSASGSAGELQAGLEALEDEMSKVRQELGEMQERLDFTERVLAQGQEARRLDREH